MPLLKDLYPYLEVDYTDGFDLEGVEIPAHIMQRILEQIPPDELTVKRLANECYEYGIMKRDEVTLINEWAEEAAAVHAARRDGSRPQASPGIWSSGKNKGKRRI